jgi:TPR repeat protein
MKNLTATICLTVALLFGCTGVCKSADFQKGLTAYQSGDYATALREWTPLAKQGIAGAQYNLGVMYGDGTGVPQDYVYAHMWYNIAAISGKSKNNASKRRGAIARTMNPIPTGKSTRSRPRMRP